MLYVDMKPFGVLLDTIMAVYGRPALNDDAKTLWADALDRYSLGAIRAGFSAYTRDPNEGHYPPRPANIVRKIRAASAGSQEEEKTALDSCYQHARRHGGAFDRLLTHRKHCDVCIRDSRQVIAEHVYVATRDPLKFYTERWATLCGRCYERTKGGFEPFAQPVMSPEAIAQAQERLRELAERMTSGRRTA